MKKESYQNTFNVINIFVFDYFFEIGINETWRGGRNPALPLSLLFVFSVSNSLEIFLNF